MIDSNMKLDIGFKGQLKLNAQVVPMQEGYLKLGGIAGANIPFGVAVTSEDDNSKIFNVGGAGTFRGIAVFDDAISQNAPAHPNEYLKGFPCAVLSHGFFWLEDYEGEVNLSSKVYFNEETGVINFSAGTEITNASIRDIDEEKGVLIYLN